jgi:thioredoxin reductase (NADPH)
MRDLVIVGSGPAGLSAAVYAKRAMMDVVVLEKEAFSGGQIVNTEQVDNYLGLPGISGFDMGMKFREHADTFGVEFDDREVTAIEDHGDHKKVSLEDGSSIETKAVLIATGAKHRKLGIPGEEEFTGAGVSYCATCDGAFFRNKEVAVVGGGNIALEDALYLSKMCSKVHLIHRRDEFRGEKILGAQVLETENIEFHPFAQVTEIGGTPGKLELKVAVNTPKIVGGQADARANVNASSEETSAFGSHDFTLPVAGVFIAIGTSPITDFLGDVVELDDAGYVAAGETGQTSTPGIFAAGDVRTKAVRQVATAVGDGAAVIHYVEEYLNGLKK